MTLARVGTKRSIGLKLTLLVLGCMVPAVVSVYLSGRAAEQQLLEQAGEVIDSANVRFEAILDDALKGTRAPLVMASENTYLARILGNRDQKAIENYLKPLTKAYRRRVVLLSDAQGEVLAAGNADRGPVALTSAGSPAFVELLAGKEVQGLLPVTTKAGPGFALVSAMPIFSAEKQQVGALAILSPITDSYLSYLGRRVHAELALSVNGTFVAHTEKHAAPEGVAPESVAFEKRAGKLWALKSFRPEALQRAGIDVRLLASHDVTKLEADSRAVLHRELAILGGLTAVVLGLALFFARRIGLSVEGISNAAAQVKSGKYVRAPVLHTGDELEELTLHFNEMVTGLEERDRLKETFGRYVTRQVADHLMKGDQHLGGEMVPVTVLFSDIRSFTSISETMEPTALLDFLNEYFAGMVESVLTHQGVVDKFIGDAIMAVFGAPVPEPEDPLRAVRAALEMRKRLEEINVGFRARGLPEIKTGIGLHSGQVVAGNMGHSERMEYTVIGDTVNLASRLEGMTKELGCDVVVSEDLYVQVENQVVAEPLRPIKVKGRDKEVMVYRLVSLRE